MRSESKYLLFISVFLAVYYLVWGIHLNNIGYSSQEALFYIEKTKIILDGFGSKLRVMGLTAPIIPFYTAFVFSVFGPLYAPVIASAICTAALFYIMAAALLKQV